MKPIAHLLIITFAGGILSGCVSPKQAGQKNTRVSSTTISRSSPYWKYAQRFVDRDPLAEAGEAFERRRRSIYSAMGYALYYPGLDYGLGRTLAAQYGSMTLPGFSDAAGDREHLAYMRFAEQYAAAYNRQMLRLLTDSGELKK